MKKINTIILTLALVLAMMPLAVFADEETPRKFGPNEPMIEDVAVEVLDAYSFSSANAIFYDKPVFEDTYTLGMEDYVIEDPGVYRIPIRPKMDCNLDLKITTDYTGNLYLGVWTAKDEGDSLKAVRLDEHVGKGSVSVSAKQIAMNSKVIVVFSFCGDYSPIPATEHQLKLNITATPLGEKPSVKCVHIPEHVDRIDAHCGFNGYKSHLECQDCGAWLIKNKSTGTFRKMTAKEKKTRILKMPAKNHSFTKKVRTADYRVRKASCTKAAKFRYVCKYFGCCGEKTYTYGKKLGHNYKKNYIIPASRDKNGKIGTICTRCKHVKKGTKIKTINKLDSMTTTNDEYVVHVDEIKETIDLSITPNFVVKDVKGKKVNKKYFTVEPMMFFDDVPMPKIPMDVDGDGTAESALVTVAANFTGRYSGTLAGGYVETTHEVNKEWISAITKYVKENFADSSNEIS